MALLRRMPTTTQLADRPVARYSSVMGRRDEILKRSTGLDYGQYTDGPLSVDYDSLMRSTGYSSTQVRTIQRDAGIGGTPLLDLRNITALVRARAPYGHGARILLKDEAANPSGSFKDRRAVLSVHHARRLGYEGVVAATSGNYGAALASQAARARLRAIVVQEVFDSKWRGQPEILEKSRKCESLGAEVIQTTVGPELFYLLLEVLDQTGYFNASLYTPFSVQGIETLGSEIAEQCIALTGKPPRAVLATHAGGGMCTGVGRGLRTAGCNETSLVGVSVNLKPLHMASDSDFNRKSFTTGHTGFSVPFTTWPDRVDVPRNAARSLRYLDRFVTVSQGSVFYTTELLSQAEGLERGPAGNTSLAAALQLARELPEDESIVVSETEYTGAGKTPVAQMDFARSMGVTIATGTEPEVPGQTIVLPTDLDEVVVEDLDLTHIRASYLDAAKKLVGRPLSEAESAFVADDAGLTRRSDAAASRF